VTPKEDFDISEPKDYINGGTTEIVLELPTKINEMDVYANNLNSGVNMLEPI